ncbi:hypothetical protein Q9R32_14530 [Actinotalea sp. AC32]|nr:hypothetical protein [Actinotalea sp. AC32]
MAGAPPRTPSRGLARRLAGVARLVTLVAAAGLVLWSPVVLAPPASAEDGCMLVEAGRDEQGNIIWEEACPGGNEDGGTTPGDGGSGGPSTPTCDLSSVIGMGDYEFCVGTTACSVNNPSRIPEADWPMEERPSPEHIYTFQWCEPADGPAEYGWSWYLPEDTGPSLSELAQSAFGALGAPVFDVGFNPPGRTVVGVETWFWAEGAGPGAISASSGVVSAVGTPARLEVDPGDGSGVMTCPFTTTESDACSHVYVRSSARGTESTDAGPAHAARMRLVYDIGFRVDGTPLTLPGLPDSLESPWTTVAVPVAEVQSVVTRG